MNPPRRFIPVFKPKSTPQERVLAAWRGVDLTPLERAQRRSERSVSELMPRVLTGLRLDERRSDREIIKVWNYLIDPAITAHAQPINIVRGTLFVSVDSSVWLDEIVRYRRREILDRLQHSFGKERVKKISFRIG